MYGHAEVGDAAHAAYERTRPDPVDAIAEGGQDNDRAAAAGTSKSQEVQTRQTGPATIFSAERFMEDDRAIKYYTGFESYKHFQYVFRCLGPATSRLEHQSRKLSPIDEFFLFMLKIRQNKDDEDLGYLFGIHRTTAGKIFSVWLDFLYWQLQELTIFVPRDIVDAYMPRDFKAKYPTTRIILDATEIPIEKPGKVKDQSATWSEYKHNNTLKTMIGITPKGTVSYISPTYGGSASDRQIIERSTILQDNLLERGESIMADRGIMVSSGRTYRKIMVLHEMCFRADATAKSYLDDPQL